MNKKNRENIILNYLERAYSNAKMEDDIGMMLKLQRAIIAFDYDEIVDRLNWDEVTSEYFVSKGFI